MQLPRLTCLSAGEKYANPLDGFSTTFLLIGATGSVAKASHLHCGGHWFEISVAQHFYSSVFRSRKALPITDTELRLIAAAANIGLSSRPKNGYRIPAAIGTPAVL